MEIIANRKESCSQLLPMENWPPNSAVGVQGAPANVAVRGLRTESTQEGGAVGQGLAEVCLLFRKPLRQKRKKHIRQRIEETQIRDEDTNPTQWSDLGEAKKSQLESLG